MAPATSTALDVKTTKAEVTRQKLIAAGIRLFSENGYEATSTRQVQTAAGVQRNLILYHFGSKEAFWKACMKDLFERVEGLMGPAMVQARDIEASGRIRFLVRRFVRASAAHPELTRIMFDEGRSDSERLTWIVDHYVRNFFTAVERLFEEGAAAGSVAAVPLVHFYYALVGSAAVFAMAPECLQLTGEDPFSDPFIDAQADAVATLLTGERADRSEREPA